VFTEGTSTVTMSGVANIGDSERGQQLQPTSSSRRRNGHPNRPRRHLRILTVNAGSVLASGTFTLTVATLASKHGGWNHRRAAAQRRSPAMSASQPRGYFGFGATTWNFAGSWTIRQRADRGLPERAPSSRFRLVSNHDIRQLGSL